MSFHVKTFLECPNDLKNNDPDLIMAHFPKTRCPLQPASSKQSITERGSLGGQRPARGSPGRASEGHPPRGMRGQECANSTSHQLYVFVALPLGQASLQGLDVEGLRRATGIFCHQVLAMTFLPGEHFYTVKDVSDFPSNYAPLHSSSSSWFPLSLFVV